MTGSIVFIDPYASATTVSAKCEGVSCIFGSSTNADIVFGFIAFFCVILCCGFICCYRQTPRERYAQAVARVHAAEAAVEAENVADGYPGESQNVGPVHENLRRARSDLRKLPSR